MPASPKPRWFLASVALALAACAAPQRNDGTFVLLESSRFT
jgi:uncharacterized lipoprotein YmbA